MISLVSAGSKPLAENGWKWLEMAGNSWNVLKLLKAGGNGQKIIDCLELVGNDKKWLKMGGNFWKRLEWLDSAGK